jgi:hypothetical protein
MVVSGVCPAAVAKAQGVRDIAFHKRGDLRIEDMVRSRWVYRKLRHFRAGIEGPISRASSGPTVWPAAPGAGSATSGPTLVRGRRR